MGTCWPPSCSRSGQRAGGASASPPRGLVRGQPSSVQMCTPSMPAPCAHQADGPEGATPQPPRGPRGLGPSAAPRKRVPSGRSGWGPRAQRSPCPADGRAVFIASSRSANRATRGGRSRHRPRHRRQWAGGLGRVWGPDALGSTSGGRCHMRGRPRPLSGTLRSSARRRAGWHVPHRPRPRARPASAQLPHGHPAAAVREDPRTPEVVFPSGCFHSSFSMRLERGRFY